MEYLYLKLDNIAMLYNLETKFIAFCKPFLQIDILFTLQLRFTVSRKEKSLCVH